MAKIKLKKLEEYLEGVDSFQDPKIVLEQYPTPPHIASCIMYNIQAQFDNIENKFVADLGCGCGMLSIASVFLGAQMTIGFEIDQDAIQVFHSNTNEMELPSVDCVQCDVVSSLPSSKWENAFDTVVMNPPFGTKNNTGIDMKFLESAIRLANGSVYSLHKSTTRDYISKKVKKWGTKGEVIAQLRYNIDSMYKFHRKRSVDVEVDFWMFDTKNKDF